VVHRDRDGSEVNSEVKVDWRDPVNFPRHDPAQERAYLAKKRFGRPSGRRHIKFYLCPEQVQTNA